METFELRLMGQKISLKTQGDPDKTRAVLELVGVRIAAVEKRVKHTTQPAHVALLALLDIAQEYVQSKERVGLYKDQIAKKSKRLVELLESAKS